MSAIARRGELVKLGRLLGVDPDAMSYVGALDAAGVRAVREALSARLFDDAKPMLQRVARGSKVLPNGTTARIAERAFGAMLCARIASLLAPDHALDLAIRMSDPFLADVSAQIDPRGASPVIGGIPADRIVAVAKILVARRDYVTMARFVDFLAPATIAAVIAAIPDELDLLHIGAYVESPAKLAELIGQLPTPRLGAMLASLQGGDGDLWREALAVAELLDDRWKRPLGDIAAELDPAVLVALVAAAEKFAVWDAALPLVLAMSEVSQRHFLALPIVRERTVLSAVLAAADGLDRWADVIAFARMSPEPLCAELARHASGACRRGARADRRRGHPASVGVGRAPRDRRAHDGAGARPARRDRRGASSGGRRRPPRARSARVIVVCDAMRLAFLVLAACGGSHPAVPLDAAPDADPKAAPCTGTFGTGLPTGFGRMDGTVLAVVPPGDEACPEPNSTHLIVEIVQQGAAYRLVVDVLSNQGSPDVLYDELDAPLAGEPWADGWHTQSPLDYATTLGVASTAFAAMHEADLVTTITGKLDLGARVSIYATVGASEPDSAHLVHRNITNQDGAIVLLPDTAPHYLLMRFDEQTF